MSFSLFDILLVIIVSQGLFLSIVLHFIPNKNTSANHILSVILCIAAIVCFGRVLVFKYNSMLITRIGTIIDGTIFLFGPLLYLYFRRLLLQEEKTYKLSAIHYGILALFSIYVIWTFTLDQEGFKTYYNNGVLPKLFFLIEFVGLFSMIFYTYKLTVLSKIYKKHEHSQIAYNQGVLSFIRRIIIALALFISIWLFSFVSFYGFRYYNPLFNYNTMWLSTSIFMYFIGFYSLAQPAIFRLPSKLIARKIPRERMSKEEIFSLKKLLNIAMNEEQIYLNSELNLAMLADHLKTSSNNLSWYLNNVENKSFYHFINEYRISAFLNKAQNNEHHSKTLLAMAFDVGFNTKSTFNKSFRTILNDTPANYIKNMS